MKYYIVDAFTNKAFGGNPAGVVLLDGDFLNDELMQQVAAEFRYSETAFVRRDGQTDFSVRYFTPAAEVDLCGHATIATFGVLRQEGMLQDGAVIINHTHAGDLMVRISDHVMMQMASPRVIDKEIDAARLHTIMAGENVCVWPNMPIEIISTGLPDIIMPVMDIQALNALQPDMASFAALSQELNVVGVHAFALSHDGYTAHVRNFAPLYGVPEESATGTANADLMHYLLLRGIISERSTCLFLQGESMGRPSEVMTMCEEGNIWVGGQSKIIAKGNLLV